MEIPYPLDDIKIEINIVLAKNDKCTNILSYLSSIKMYILCAASIRDDAEKMRLLKAAINSYEIILNILCELRYLNSRSDLDESIIKISINKMKLNKLFT